MAGGRFHLTFPEHLIHEPVVYTLGKRFGLVTNIRRASVEERAAWMILEIHGGDDAIADALAWLAEQGVHVDRIHAGSDG